MCACKRAGDFGHLYLVDAVVLLADVREIMLPVKRHHRLAIFRS